MPRIPTLQNTEQLRPLPNVRLRETPQSGLAEFGRGIADIGTVLDDVRRQERAKADRAAFMEADRQLGTRENSLLYDPEAGAFTKQGKDALGITPSALSEYDKAGSEIEQTLTTDRQKLAFREALNQRRVDVERQLQRHEGNQREVHYAAERLAYQEAAQSSAILNYTDHGRVAKEIDKIRATIDQTPGLSVEQRAVMLADKAAGVHTGIIDRYLANDQLKGAQAYYGANKGALSGESAIRVERALTQARDRLEAKAKQAIVNRYAATIMSEYTSAGPEAGAAELAKLAKSKLPPDVQRAVYTAVNADQSRLREVVQQENAAGLADLYTRIANNTAGNEANVEADLLWQKGAFTPTEYASLIGRIENSQLQGAIDGAASLQVRQALETGMPIDPANPKVSKALNAAFAQDVLNLKVGSEPWQAAAAAYATRTRALPEQAESWVRASLRSPDAAVAARAAQFMGGVDATAPDALSRFDPTTKSLAAMMNSMISAGTDPQKAIEAVRERVLDTNPAIMKSRTEQFSAGGKNSLAATAPSALKSFVDRDFDTVFSSEPAVTEALAVDFKGQFEKYFVRTGDAETARELAWSDLKRVYGPTRVNGSLQMMALPPERFGISPEDVKKTVSAFIGANPQADGSSADEVVLVPDGLTLREVTNMLDGAQVMPTYGLVTKTGDKALNSAGIPQRYTLPAADDLAKRIAEGQAKAAAEAQQSIDQARADRAARRQREQLLRGGELR